MKKRKRLLCVLLAAVLLLGVLAGCGGRGPEKDVPSGSSESGKPGVESTTPDEGPENEPMPEPEPAVPYAEANGLSFTKEKGYTLPAFTFFRDEVSGEPTTIDGLSIAGVVDSNYTFGDISVSETDVDGMVQMTIPLRIDLVATVTQDISVYDGQWRFGWGCQDASLFDQYTGIVIPDKTLSTNSDKLTDILENAIDITYKDITYPIAYMESATQNVDEDWAHMGGDVYEFHENISIDISYTIYMPEEYDGLCLYLNLLGNTEYEEPKEELSDITTLLDDIEDDISNYALIRVSDLM